MKKKVIIFLSAALIFIIGIVIAVFLAFSGFEKNLEELKKIPISDVDLTQISDGTYRGSYSHTPVSAEVEVTVKDYKITKIDIISHDNGFGKKAEAITDEVVEKGTLKVDAVSGATHSSLVILKAIENALTGAVGK